MKNNLHVFGCSYSQLTTDITYPGYYEWYNGNTPPTWSEILAAKLDLNLCNYAKGGDCNELIFQRFCQEFENFSENDVVIFQWSYPARYSVADENGNLFSSAFGDDGVLSREFGELLSIIKSADGYLQQLKDYQKIIDFVCKSKGINIWYWNGDGKTNRYVNELDKRNLIFDEILKDNNNWQKTTFDVVYGLGGCDIEKETKGEVRDNHFGKTAHEIKAELFYNHIKKYQHLYN
jgi:hypothetical protein